MLIFRVLGVAALCLTAGACASINGLSKYSDCSEGCPDATAHELDAAEADNAANEAGVEIEGGAPSEDASSGGCPVRLTACSGECVDLTSPSNCGTCGNACSTMVANAVPACVNEACSFTCSNGYSLCGGECVDYETTTNCGSCGNACTGSTPVCGPGGDAGLDAEAYSCLSGCPASTPTLCSGTCVDTMTSPGNCGICGNACSTRVANATAACVDSACTFTCNSGYTLCSGACVNEQTDNNNCGGCGALYTCASGHVCQTGACTCSAPLCPSCPPLQNPCCTSLGLCGCAQEGLPCN